MANHKCKLLLLLLLLLLLFLFLIIERAQERERARERERVKETRNGVLSYHGSREFDRCQRAYRFHPGEAGL
ncbi:hypothetical protein QUF72_19295 [Desulfobacterales bacterium HSG2]|nr:hypothetical protein [Desulfobacterales bacterium HSG2]